MAIDRTATTAYAGTRYAPRNHARTVAEAASDKQISFISDMVREIHKLQVRELSLAQGEHSDATRALALGTLGTEEDAVSAQLAQTFTYGETGTINRLIAARNRHRKLAQEMARRATAQATPVQASEPAVAATELTPGTVYRAPDGRVFLCVLGRESGKIYGKVWTPDGTRTADGKESGSFEYLPGIRNITGLVSLTLAEAAEFGQRTGQCCVCCTPLSDPISVILGIGPVCESKYTGKARSRSAKYRAEVLASAQA